MRITPARRRLTALLATAAAIALILTGCASNSPRTDDATASQASADAAFPATIDTAYGEITVKKKPERIVVVPTLSYVELLNILGETPLAWNAGPFGTTADVIATQPWSEKYLDSEPDSKLYTAEYKVSAEAVAALKPDLILTDIWSTDKALYEQLSAIAPTYVGIKTDTQTSWQDNLGALAQLTGHDPAIVQETESELDAVFAAVSKRLPGLQGKTFIAAATDDNAVFWLCDYPNSGIEGLGLVPDKLQASTGAGCPKTNYSWEQLDEFTADVVFFSTLHRDRSGATQAKLEADPRLAELPAAGNGTIVYFVPAATWSAINGGTPASYRWWLEQDFVTQLENSALNQSGK